MPNRGKERELDDFKKAFSFLKGEKVIFYGTGQYTELLLREPLEFQVIGLMGDRTKENAYYGLPVLNEESVRCSGCKVMIIIANLSTAPIIYQRIKNFALDCGIEVYYMNGKLAGESACPAALPYGAEYACPPYEKLMAYDIVSFDLFDTLIMRKCLMPKEVFTILEGRAKKQGLALADFPVHRHEAETTLYHGGVPFYDLDDIYEWLKEFYSLSLDQMEQLKRLELEIELEMCIPREDVIRCFRKLVNSGKQVVITSDMYLTTAQLQPLLSKCGLDGAELYISNECKASKHLGTLFQYLRKRFPEIHMIHIGDNPHADIEKAKENGVDAYLIPKASVWAEAYDLSALKDADRYIYALFVQRCFSSAFQERSAQGKISISDPKDVGYLFFGPLAVGFLAWLIEQLQRSDIQHLLFVSRDGYLFYRLYQKTRKLYSGLPRASYFLTSRRCAGAASLKTAEDVRFVFEEICYSRTMRFGDILEKAYGISADADDPVINDTLLQLGNEQAWDRIQARYMDRILAKAAEERSAYLSYVGSLGLSASKIGMMNFVGRGVTQKCLQHILEREIIGFYFALEYDAKGILGKETIAQSWYSEPLSTHTGKSKLAEQLLLGETVFSAPHGAVLGFSKNGEPIYEPTSKERARLIEACHRGIEEYFEDVLLLDGGFNNLRDSVNTADHIFGLLRDSRFVFSESIRNGFQFEDRFQ